MEENDADTTASLQLSKTAILKSFFLGGAVIIALLVVGDVYFNFFDVFDTLQIRRIFNIAKEGSVPSFFSVFLLLCVSLFALCFFWINYKRLSTARKGLWLFVAFFFLFLATDDAAQIHERLGSVFRKQVAASSEAGDAHWGAELLESHGSYSWHVAVLPFLALAGFGMFLFLWIELGDRLGRALLSSGILCFVLAIGIDYLEGLDTFFVTLGKPLEVGDYFINHFCKVIEECLEMIGATLIAGTILRHLLNSTTRIEMLIQE